MDHFSYFKDQLDSLLKIYSEFENPDRQKAVNLVCSAFNITESDVNKVVILPNTTSECCSSKNRVCISKQEDKRENAFTDYTETNNVGSSRLSMKNMATIDTNYLIGDMMNYETIMNSDDSVSPQDLSLSETVKQINPNDTNIHVVRSEELKTIIEDVHLVNHKSHLLSANDVLIDSIQQTVESSVGNSYDDLNNMQTSTKFCTNFTQMVPEQKIENIDSERPSLIQSTNECLSLISTINSVYANINSKVCEGFPVKHSVPESCRTEKIILLTKNSTSPQLVSGCSGMISDGVHLRKKSANLNEIENCGFVNSQCTVMENAVDTEAHIDTLSGQEEYNASHTNSINFQKNTMMSQSPFNALVNCSRSSLFNENNPTTCENKTYDSSSSVSSDLCVHSKETVNNAGLVALNDVDDINLQKTTPNTSKRHENEVDGICGNNNVNNEILLSNGEDEFQKEIIPDSHQIQCFQNKLFCPASGCNRQFLNKVSYTKHVGGHNRNSCMSCGMNFSSYKLLKLHAKDEHNEALNAQKYICGFCGRTFCKKLSLYGHYKIHAIEAQIVCQKCGEFCASEENYKTHNEKHVQESNYKCNLCPEVFLRRQQYTDHILGHAKNECQFCSESFPSKRALIKHARKQHNKIPTNVVLSREYKCSKCSRIFNRPSLLNRHLQVHDGVKLLDCQMCAKKFYCDRSLKKHLTSASHQLMVQAISQQYSSEYSGSNESLKQDNFFCRYCDATFPFKANLTAHCLVVHKVRNKWSCHHCDFECKSKNALRRHMNLHEDTEKRYMCEICGSAFHTLATLKEHHVFIHSDERNFKCDNCDLTFKNKSSLARHCRAHSNSRPYTCSCGSKYKRLSHLKRHMSSAHNESLSSRAVKRIKTVEERDEQYRSSGERDRMHTEHFLGLPDPSLSLCINKESQDVLLHSNESLLVLGNGSHKGQLISVPISDSQIIQFLPSSSFQLSSDGFFQTVSLVSSCGLETTQNSSSFSHFGSESGIIESISNVDGVVMVQADHAHNSVMSDMTSAEVLMSGLHSEESILGRTCVLHVSESVKHEGDNLIALADPISLPVNSDLHMSSFKTSLNSMLPSMSSGAQYQIIDADHNMMHTNLHVYHNS